MKTGVLILKPDLFDSQEHQEKLLELLDKYKVNDIESYIIHDFGTFCEQYRSFDVVMSSYLAKQMGVDFDFSTEKRRTAYATFAYQNKYKRRYGMALLCHAPKEESDELFERLRMVKKELRAHVLSSRPFEYYVDTKGEYYNDNWSVYKHYKDNKEDQDYINRDDVKLVYINSIHLEEKEMYDHDVCMEFIRLQNIGSRKNKIDLKEAIKNGELYEIGKNKQW